nr:MAG TPA: Myosin [Caudoviricetes sp.]
MRQEGLRPLFCRMRWWDRNTAPGFGNMVYRTAQALP